MGLPPGCEATCLKQQILAEKLILILRGVEPGEVREIAGHAISGGARFLEVALNSPKALESISVLAGEFSDEVVPGAGTVMSVEMAERAIEVGARYLISPCFNWELADRSRDWGVPYIPGIFTPTELALARSAGCALFKLFPAMPAGPAYLRNLLGPFSDAALIAVGGITPENAPAFLDAGAAGLAVGSSVVPTRSAAQDWSVVAERMRALKAIAAGGPPGTRSSPDRSTCARGGAPRG